MSSNPTQPKFGDQGEGVSFPPEDDAEGHRFAAAADGDQPEGFRAGTPYGADGGPEGLKTLADSEDDTEGHARLVMADGGEDDTEGHRIAAYSGPGGEPQDGPEAARDLMADGEDDTEGHRVFTYADGDQDGGPEGFAAR